MVVKKLYNENKRKKVTNKHKKNHLKIKPTIENRYFGM